MSTISSPNMSLPVPVVGQESGPEWATDLNNCMAIIDAHSHVPGSGVPITPSALNINSDLTISNNNLTNIRSVRFTPQVAALAGSSDIGCLYEVSDDLYYNDGAGNQIRLTQSGSIVGTAGSITGLPSGNASAAYNGISSTFVWQSNTNIAANMDFGSAVMRNLSPNSTFALTLSPPASLGSNYALTLPSLPASTRILSLSTSGIIATGVAGAIVTADIGTQQVTQATLAARATGTTVGAGGVAISTSCGNFSTTSTSFTAVTNLSVTITTTGRPVVLQLIPDGSSYPTICSILALTNSGVLAFYRDGSSVSQSIVPALNTAVALGSYQTLNIVTAGTYVYSVQVRMISSGTLSVSKAFLVAYEL